MKANRRHAHGVAQTTALLPTWVKAGPMTGRHRRCGTHPRIPEQRGPRPVGIVDATTRVEHLVSDPVVEYRHAGRYLALCGIEVLAASLTEPGRGQCRPCREQAVS